MRQALDSAKISGADAKTQKSILDEAMHVLPVCDLGTTPPEIAHKVYGIVRRLTKNKDAYLTIKEDSNRKAMELYPQLKKTVKNSADPLMSAVRLAVAGNVIDYGLPHAFDINTEIEECLKKDFAIFDFDRFRDALDSADRVLYILDNAGEIVFDRILIEEMKKEVICAVREKPVINDVTRQDAVQTGLDSVATIITSGSEFPGTVLNKCRKGFLEEFSRADMVISKGQGNFETLSEANRIVFFILKVKCAVVARHLECDTGDIVLKKHQSRS